MNPDSNGANNKQGSCCMEAHLTYFNSSSLRTLPHHQDVSWFLQDTNHIIKHSRETISPTISAQLFPG